MRRAALGGSESARYSSLVAHPPLPLRPIVDVGSIGMMCRPRDAAMEKAMKSRISTLMFVATLLLAAVPAFADEYSDTIAIFKKAGESAAFFNNSYAYLVVPHVGKGGLGVGA